MCISVAAVFVSLVLLTIIRIKSEKLFVHKNLLLTMGLGNLVRVLDVTFFKTREKYPESLWWLWVWWQPLNRQSYDMGKVTFTDITCGSLVIRMGIKRDRCWLNGNQWIFKGPVLAILLERPKEYSCFTSFTWCYVFVWIHTVQWSFALSLHCAQLNSGSRVLSFTAYLMIRSEKPFASFVRNSHWVRKRKHR